VRIAGCSFGGLVAIELVRRLQAGGRAIGLLALLDTYGPKYPRVRRGSLARWRYLGERWRNLVAEPRSNGMQRSARQLLARVRMTVQPMLSQPRLDQRFLYLREAAFGARRRYRPAPIDVDAVLVRMNQQPDLEIYEDDPLLGLDRFVRGEIEVAQFDGRHGDYLREPLASEVATFLDARRARPRESLAMAGVE